MTARYNADKDPSRVNLGIGAYRTDKGEPYVFSAVRKAKASTVAAESGLESNHEYLPIGGLPEFCKSARKLMFGADSIAIAEKLICTVQSISGTGALRIAADFIKTHMSSIPAILISDPTWANHPSIFEAVGLGGKLVTYRYYDEKTRGLDFDGMVEDLNKTPDASVVVN